jgi:hypothetical protein
MRGSGSDAKVEYSADPDEDPEEGNDTWKKLAGSSVTSHPDTCDAYGNLWDYNGTEVDVVDTAGAAEELVKLFPANTRNAVFYTAQKGYINMAQIVYITGSDGVEHRTMFAMSYSISGRTSQMSTDWGMYLYHLSKYPTEELLAQDAIGYNGIKNLIIELDSSAERCQTLLKLCRMAYGTDSGTIYVDNGVGSLYGRFSLKLRAQKPNPYFDPTQPESVNNKRYLEIDDENLQQRGLTDTFYKEYSYWVRNARICKRTVRMTLANLLKIDKTKKVKIGDVTGFVRKIQYTVSKKSGLGMATFEIMYI